MPRRLIGGALFALCLAVVLAASSAAQTSSNCYVSLDSTGSAYGITCDTSKMSALNAIDLVGRTMKFGPATWDECQAWIDQQTAPTSMPASPPPGGIAPTVPGAVVAVGGTAGGVAGSPAAAPMTLSYTGVATYDGQPARMTLTIAGAAVTGTLSKTGVCRDSIRLTDTNLNLTGTLAGPWEGSGTISGSWTGGDSVCGTQLTAADGYPQAGTFTVTMTGTTVQLLRTGAAPLPSGYTYDFRATGTTVPGAGAVAPPGTGTPAAGSDTFNYTGVATYDGQPATMSLNFSGRNVTGRLDKTGVCREGIRLTDTNLALTGTLTGSWEGGTVNGNWTGGDKVCGTQLTAADGYPQAGTYSIWLNGTTIRLMRTGPGGGDGGGAATCNVDTTDLAPGIQTPGRILNPGSYVLWTRVEREDWRQWPAVNLTGGHRYLVDITRGNTFVQDDSELGTYSRMGDGELVVHYRNGGGTSGKRMSATVCPPGAMPATMVAAGPATGGATAGPFPTGWTYDFPASGRRYDPAPADGGALDLIFVIDLTSSMSDDIDQVKTSAKQIGDDLRGRFSDVRIAIVGYRDWGDEPMFEDYPFSPDPATFVANINKLSVSGGGDTPEAALEGLFRAIETTAIGPWRDGVEKQIILMGDAPPHSPIPQGPHAGETAAEVAVAAYNVDPAVINTVLVGNSGSFDGDARVAFEDLASRTGGISVDAASAAEVPVRLREAIRDMKPWAGGGGGGPPVMGGSQRGGLSGQLVLLAFMGLACLVVLGAIAYVVTRRPAGASMPTPFTAGVRRTVTLMVTYADGGTKSGRLDLTHRVSIGRDEASDLCLHDADVSSRHAQMAMAGNELVVTDLGSANGTYVNGSKVGRASVKPGDELRFGTTTVAITALE